MQIKIYLFFIVALIPAIALAQSNSEPVPQPTLISAPAPVYPAEAKEALIGGAVTVRVEVDETGAVVSVGDPIGPTRLCDSGLNDPRLEAMRASVVTAIKQAKFSPAVKDGKAVKSVTFVTSTFDPYGKPPGAPARRIINAGVVNGKAKRLPRPDYPSAARGVRASGAVSVQVVVDEDGKVFAAEALSGHPLLRGAAVDAACNAKFSPTSLDGVPVRVRGVITYNFVP